MADRSPQDREQTAGRSPQDREQTAAPSQDDGEQTAGTGQQRWDLRFDWGADGLDAIGPGAGSVVVVDVLRFTTAVSVAVSRGAVVLPYVWDLGRAARSYADNHGAELAGRREDGGWSLSPTDLAAIPAEARLVLPSPNGSSLVFGAGDHLEGATVLAGSLRNAAAVAAVAGAAPGAVAVVAAGERWRGNLGPLRPCVEDLIGAGAVLRALVGVADRRAERASPEARAAMAAFDAARDDLHAALAGSVGGAELAGLGFDDDVAAAAELDADPVAPVLVGRQFVGVTPEGAGHLR